VSETRGRGRPKLVDELELVEQIGSREDLFRIQEALVANGEPAGQSRSLIFWLDAVRAGDPTGGYGERQRRYFRAMLARLPEIPLPPANRRRRRTAARGSAAVSLLAGSAGAGALLVFAAQPGPVALRLVAALGAPIMPEASGDDVAAEIPGLVLILGARSADVARECVPAARSVPPATHVGYTLATLAEAA